MKVETGEAELNQTATEIGRIIGRELPKDVGFGLFLFNFGDDDDRGFMAWISNAERKAVILALKEWIAHAEADRMRGAES